MEILENYLKLYDNLNSEIEKGIEARRQKASLRVVDTDGNPITGAKITFRQRTQDFAFGCNALKLGQCGIDDQLYEERLAGLFNLVTTTLCLSDIEPVPGEWRFAEGSREIFRRPPPDRVLSFANRHGMAVKGQPLLAGSWFPKWAAGYSEAQIYELYDDYFRRVAERYGRSFKIFDIVNEAFCHTKFPLYTEDCGYVDRIFDLAKKYFTDGAVRELNEATFVNTWSRQGERYYNLAKRLLDNGHGLDSIGFQFHMFTPGEMSSHLDGKLLNPEEIYENYMRFSELGVPLYISEITIPSVIDGMSREESEIMQAEVAERLYSLWFSIPNMAGIIWWNLNDGVHWRNEGDCRGCLCDTNLNPKPSYQRLEQMIKRRFMTSGMVESGREGIAELQGFCGGYTGEAVFGEKSGKFAFDLKKDMGCVTVVIE